jgi:hypothetical protein
MMALELRKLAAAALLLAAPLLGACSDADNGDGPVTPAPTALVVAPGATSATLTFTGSTGATYVVERADGGAAFAQVATVPAPASGVAVTYVDQGLDPQTQYRYRVSAVVGGVRSAFTSEVSTTTLALGAAAAEITQDITADRTLYADTTYTLNGFIHVTNGAKLTIQPGTTIKGKYETLGSSLFIMRGAQILAEGTEARPIVFTSSRAAGERQAGDWGGLVIIGNSSVNRSGDPEIEGTGTVGGTDSGTNYRVSFGNAATPNDADNSGILKYVRVEFAGYAPSLNNELNSFTFASVGSGTKLSYLQAMGGLDDSFEWFGGTVDADHLVSYEAGDDHFDMSTGYRGRAQYLIAYQSGVPIGIRANAGAFSGDPQGIENDGCDGAGCDLAFNSTPLTIPLVANFTLVGTGNTASSGGNGGVGVFLRRGTGGYYVNGLLARWPRAAFSVRDADTYARAGNAASPDLATTDLAIRNVTFVETPTVFQAASGTNVQNVFDQSDNALVANAGPAAAAFTALPATVDDATTAAAFDWTPPAGSAGAAGGLETFTGKLAAKAGTAFPGTSYIGAAAPGGPKWWQNWTVYLRN